MKILITTNYFLPGVKGGGPIKSVNNLIENLYEEYEIYVITKSKDVGEETNYPNIAIKQWLKKDKYKIMYVEGFSIPLLNKIINEIHPDIVYLNSIFATSSMYTYPLIPIYKRIKFVVSPRGELNSNALSIKSFKKSFTLRMLKTTKLLKNVMFHATSIEEEKDIKSYFPENKVEVISNLPSLIKDNLNNLKKVKDHLKIVSISRVSKMKNIDYFLEILMNINFGKIQYDIYGPIEDKDYYNLCCSIIKKMPKNVDVRFMGAIKSADVSDVLSQYNLFVSTTLGENFGHSIIEAIQSQTPVLISKNTPWLNLEKYNVGYDIDLVDKELMSEKLKEILIMNEYEYKSSFNGQHKFLEEVLNISDIKNRYNRMFEVKL